ncbi:MAG: hypothetical protein ABI543_00585 [Ignavibacteria bacterium]
MSNSKFNLRRALIAVLFAFAVFFSACSEDNPLNSASDEFNPVASMPPATITIEPYWVGNVLQFKLINNSRDTIVNDFHVQFDPTVKIIGWVTMPGWQIDPATTDTANGKIGVKKGPQGQPILPMGGVGLPIAVQIKFAGVTKKNPNHWWDFSWQATRDGIVVRSGQDAFPPR